MEDVVERRRRRFDYESRSFMLLTLAVDGAILAAAAQAQGWIETTDQTKAALGSAILMAMVSASMVFTVFYIREGIALTDLREVDPSMGKPPRRHPAESRLRRWMVGNGVMVVGVPMFVAGWSLLVAFMVGLDAL